PDQLHDALVAEYLAARQRKENVLVVAQTREEVGRVNDSIRSGVALSGALGEGCRVATQEAMGWTEAQKCDARFYQPGQQVQFLKRYGRFRAGDSCEIVGTSERGLVLF